jgi:hydroxylamine reductase
VTEGTKAGPGILVTGHDLMDLWQLLQQVEGTDIKVYTHGEMLPAHMYAKFQAHPNLAGHYGGAWQEQKKEFAAFPGPVVGTTNCVLIPPESYKGRLFTTNAVAVPDGQHIEGGDFSPVIAAVRACEPCVEQITGHSTVGFHRTVLLEQAQTIVDAVKAGKISRFFVIGGCDGAEKGRNYFTDYALATPPDSFILTLGCGKFRIREHDYGEHLGLPRLMDMGQCNDAYGAIAVAVALAEAFECSVNDLPLTLVISWFEQKAVAVLLTLLHLGVKGIVSTARPWNQSVKPLKLGSCGIGNLRAPRSWALTCAIAPKNEKVVSCRPNSPPIPGTPNGAGRSAGAMKSSVRPGAVPALTNAPQMSAVPPIGSVSPRIQAVLAA